MKEIVLGLLILAGVFFLGVCSGYHYQYYSHDGHRVNGEWVWPEGTVELEIIDVRAVEIKDGEIIGERPEHHTSE